MQISQDKAYLARQPILDANRKLHAYELLFRNPPATFAEIGDATQATAQVIINTINSIGTRQLVGSAKAFINCDRKMLLESALGALDPKVFVVEVLEDVAGDQAIVQALHSIKEAGFQIALDDFIMESSHVEKTKSLFALADYVKVDLMASTPQQIQDAASLFRGKPIQLLAEKVEDEAMFRNCLKMGYTLFQGYFFAKPELMEGNRLDPRHAGVLQLLQVLRKNPEINQLEDAFKRQPEITMNLLKFINSASMGLRNPVSSIRQALTLIGQKKLQQWLMLMMYAGHEQNQSSILFDNACQRARTMELLAKEIAPHSDLSEKAFLVGMLSRMDALCKVELQSVIQGISLGSDMEEALLKHQGILGTLLNVSAELESQNLPQAATIAQQVKLRSDQLQHAQIEAWSWIESLRA